MSRFLILLGLIGVVLGSTATIARAQEVPMTEEHIQRIKANCVQAKVTLYQLHASDGLLRVNRGQLFESIATKLMAPFNSRVALNRLDSGKLVSITSVYGKEWDGFRTDYQQYEEALSHLLQIDCQKQPVAFYDGVAEARAKRDAVHTRAVALQKATRDYREAFDAFAATFKEEAE